ncbi:LysR substrate-binding domain-containing protein [Pseudomonas brassicacearum]|uniref:LysR substrate-binding domain-containing protein n=1 Tax=Pseudomonas brassicacearum TaxID=930166 RepID=UPI003AABEC4E
MPHLQADFFQQRLLHHRYVCLYRKSHPATREQLTLERFCSYDHVHVVAANTRHGVVDTFLAREGIEQNIRLEVPYFVAIGHMIQHSIMFTARPPRAVSLYLLFMSAPV